MASLFHDVFVKPSLTKLWSFRYLSKCIVSLVNIELHADLKLKGIKYNSDLWQSFLDAVILCCLWFRMHICSHKLLQQHFPFVTWTFFLLSWTMFSGVIFVIFGTISLKSLSFKHTLGAPCHPKFAKQKDTQIWTHIDDTATRAIKVSNLWHSKLWHSNVWHLNQRHCEAHDTKQSENAV